MLRWRIFVEDSVCDKCTLDGKSLFQQLLSFELRSQGMTTTGSQLFRRTTHNGSQLILWSDFESQIKSVTPSQLTTEEHWSIEYVTRKYPEWYIVNYRRGTNFAVEIFVTSPNRKGCSAPGVETAYQSGAYHLEVRRFVRPPQPSYSAVFQWVFFKLMWRRNSWLGPWRKSTSKKRSWRFSARLAAHSRKNCQIGEQKSLKRPEGCHFQKVCLKVSKNDILTEKKADRHHSNAKQAEDVLGDAHLIVGLEEFLLKQI